MARVVDDYYATLNVSPLATQDTIRESYLKLALRFHPDKNRDESATQDFQRLIDAWETLRDVRKRNEYDRCYMCASSAGSLSEDVQRRRQEVDREAMARWGCDDRPRPGDGEERKAKARAWKEAARNEYHSRLQMWQDFRDARLVSIRQRQILIRRVETNLYAQVNMPEAEMIRQFRDAIKRSKAKIQDPSSTLSRLLAARDNYIRSLMRSIKENQGHLKEMFHELDIRRRQYEEEETGSRETRIQEALQILGPRDLKPPLFSIIDRRGQSINRWKALSRVKTGLKPFTSLEGASEEPWHKAGEWKRVAGEHSCARCEQEAHHIILDYAPARCPGCDMIVCNDCYRDLRLLREYHAWITGPADDLRDSFFSVEFEANPPTTMIEVGALGYNFAYEVSQDL